MIWVLSSKAAFRLREKNCWHRVRVKIRSKINEKKIETKTFQRQLPVTATSETQLAPPPGTLLYRWTGLPVKGLG